MEPQEIKNMIIKVINRGVERASVNDWKAYQADDDAPANLDRSAYVTSSEIGQCERKVYFDKVAMRSNGYDPTVGTKVDARTDWGYAIRGHNVERWIVDMLRLGNDGEFRFHFMGEDQRSFIGGYQAGTPDGVCFVGEDHFFTVEFKSIDPRTNASKLPKKEHVKQVIQNTDLIAENMELSPLGGLILYVDASNYKNRYPFWIDFDESVADELIERAQRIIEAESAVDLQPEGMFIDRGCNYCNHTAQCSALVRTARGNLGNDKLIAASGQFFGQRKTDDGPAG